MLVRYYAPSLQEQIGTFSLIMWQVIKLRESMKGANDAKDDLRTAAAEIAGHLDALKGEIDSKLSELMTNL